RRTILTTARRSQSRCRPHASELIVRHLRARARSFAWEEPTMNGNGGVLVVDDHAPLARSLVSLLSASGFDAQAVHSGAEALAFVRSHAAVALVLLALLMPDMAR